MALSEQHVIPCKKFMGYFHGKKKLNIMRPKKIIKVQAKKYSWNESISRIFFWIFFSIPRQMGSKYTSNTRSLCRPILELDDVQVQMEKIFLFPKHLWNLQLEHVNFPYICQVPHPQLLGHRVDKLNRFRRLIG